MAFLGYKNEKKAQFSDLAGWLDIATSDLEPSAQQRIATEIQSHFTDSVAAHLAGGQSETAAQSTALSELGDPIKAASRFAQIHLTANEANYLSRLEKRAARPLFSRGPFFPLDLFGVAVLLFFTCTRGSISHLLSGLALFTYLNFRLGPRLLFHEFGPSAAFRRGVRLGDISALVALFAILQMFNWIDHKPLPDYFGPASASCHLFFWGFYFAEQRRRIIWRKLKKVNYERHDQLTA